MTTPQVDGARPLRAGAAAAGSSSTGSTPRPDAAAVARSKQLAAQFVAQMEMSMLQSLNEIGASDDAEGSEESGEGDDAGMDLNMGIDLTAASSGAFSQAQLSALGSDLTGAGAGSEAQLAKQLLASLGVDPAAANAIPGLESSAATSQTQATPFAGAVDRGAAANAQVVAQAARERGVDPTVAVAMMLVESGGRSTAVGDNGTSFGLFQLHEGGMLTAAGLTKQQAFDPRTNANVALKSYAHEWSKGHARRSPGEIAAASQRPADPVGYAAKVDGAMARARALLAGT